MKIKLPDLSIKAHLAIIMAIFMIIAIAWLGSSIPIKDVEKSMYERFNARLEKNVIKINCYGGIVGKEERRELTCNFLSSEKDTWDVRYIDFHDDINPPIWSTAGIQIDEIFYESNSHRKIQLLIHSFGDRVESISRASAYWLYAVVDGILAAQPQ